MKKIIKELYHFGTLRMLFPFYYKMHSLGRIKRNKVIFIEANLPGLSNSLQVLYDRLKAEGGYELKVHCLREVSVSKGVYIRNAMRLIKDMADAGCIVLCEGSRLVSCIPKRKETKVLQLWHGCGAFKRFGFSTSELLFGGDRKQNSRYSYYKNYDLVTVSSPEVVWAYKEAMNMEADSQVIRPLGVSRTDIYFDLDFVRQAREYVKERLSWIGNRKIILYAPTFRGSVGDAKAPDALDFDRLYKEFGAEYVLLIKQHPLAKKRPVIPERLKEFARDVSDEMSIEELLCSSDLCISDYSSLIFEYSLFEKPMIFYAYDLENYGDWRGFYYDYEELTPGPVVKTMEELVNAIHEVKDAFDVSQVRHFKEKFMSACDGHATDRIMKMIKTG